MPERDPATIQALGDQIMVDPDLARQNEANAALTGGSDHSIPPVVATREEIADARLEAADLAGGSRNLVALGKPRAVETPLAENVRYSVLELAKVTSAPSACVEAASFSARWAGRMPESFPIYPRGNTIEAAGSDDGRCALRAVRFLTPVDGRAVLTFYAAKARKAGLPRSHFLQGDSEILRGSVGKKIYIVHVSQRPSGLSEVGLVTSGL
ncbi:MAG: hypothetical protein HKO05_03715 [Erythrobacter sp.]|nr:hypothetical protein [Erythrobacter sp.]